MPALPTSEWLRALEADPASAEQFSPLFGVPLLVLDLDDAEVIAACRALLDPFPAIVVGIDRQGSMPAEVERYCDLLLTTTSAPGRAWVCPEEGIESAVEAIRRRVETAPFAATSFARLLRMNTALSLADGVIAESFAYSMLLASSEFRAWRDETPARPLKPEAGAVVVMERRGAHITVRLNRPHARNATSSVLRDELAEALNFIAADPSIAAVDLRAEGPAFCAGGDLNEFGTASDPARAHATRTLRSAAVIAHRLGTRLTAWVQGACVGSGIEIAAACHRVVAKTDSFFQLPEIGFGLVPGAGGTATLPPRIGRWRTAYLGLSGARINARTALAWGLVDTIDDTDDCGG